MGKGKQHSAKKYEQYYGQPYQPRGSRKFEVIFLRGRELQSVAFSDKTEEEARRIADSLNDSLQDKAKDMGFRYEARPQERIQTPCDYCHKRPATHSIENGNVFLCDECDPSPDPVSSDSGTDSLTTGFQ